MTTEELLIPRVKMIAPVPEYGMKVGTVITKDKNLYFELRPGYKINLVGIRQYPHIYKELFWWEERSIEDMPEYVRKVGNDGREHKKGDVVLVEHWELDEEKNPYFFDGNDALGWYCDRYEPATLQEYQSYQSINSLK